MMSLWRAEARSETAMMHHVLGGGVDGVDSHGRKANPGEP